MTLVASEFYRARIASRTWTITLPIMTGEELTNVYKPILTKIRGA